MMRAAKLYYQDVEDLLWTLSVHTEASEELLTWLNANMGASTEENISVQDREGRQVLALLALLALLLHTYLLYWYKSRGEHPRPAPRGTLGTRAYLLYWCKSTHTDAAHPHPQSRYWDFYRSEQTQEEPYRQVLH